MFLSRKCPLRDLTEARATDLMLFLASPGAYRALVLERGWTHAEWVAWTSGALAQQLFEGGGRPSGRPAALRGSGFSSSRDPDGGEIQHERE